MIKTILSKVFVPVAILTLFFVNVPATLAASISDHELFFQKKDGALVSQVILEKEAFNTAILTLSENVEEIMVNYGKRWEEVEVHDDGFGIQKMLTTSPTHTIQLKIPVKYEASLKASISVFFDQATISHPVAELQASTASVQQGLKIISRNEWGADEELRIWNPDKKTSSSGPSVNPCAEIETKYKNEFQLSQVREYTSDGQYLTWPLQYVKKIEKFAVHHTDSDIRDLNGDALTDTSDYEEMVRAIYRYHTVTRGWGDVGYNYLIDPLGNIYEGRYGGDKVIGAHSICYNHAVLGIALIGNYDTQEVPEPALQSLIRLIAVKSKENGIDPKGLSDFRGKRLYNIFGHKDVKATSCPGAILYSDLPDIRDKASLAMRSFSESTLSAASLDYNAELSGAPGKPTLGPGQQSTITVKYKNTGKQAWNDTTWMHVSLNNDPNARVVPAVEGKSFVAADLKESKVEPGGIGTFEVEVEGGFRAGHYSFQVSPVVNGRYKISRASEYISFDVSPADYNYEVVGHEFPKGTVFQGQHILATLKLKNTGNTTWRNYGVNAITLGASEPKDRASIFVKNNPTRIGHMIDSEVAPGGEGDFVLDLIVPEDKTGEVIERFTPVIENVGWLKDTALGFKVFLKKPVHLAKTTKLERLGFMAPGERRYVTVKMQNIGDLTWDSTTVETTLLGRGMKIFKRSLLPPEEVKPGKDMTVGFWVEAPLEAGQHSIYLRSRFNGKPIRGGVAQFIVEVPSPVLRGVKNEQSDAFIDMAQGRSKELTVTFKNTGNTVWKKMGYHAVHLGTSNPSDRSSRLYVKDTWLSEQRIAEMQEEEVMPGEIGTFKFKIQSDIRGKFEEDFQLVMEHFGWITGASVKIVANVSNTVASTPKVSTPVSTPVAPIAPVVPVVASIVDAEPIVQQTSDRPFRVRLSHDATSATLTADKAFMVLNQSNQVLFNLSAGKEVTVKKLTSNFEVKSGTYTKTTSVVRIVPKDAGGVVQILSMERRPEWNKDLNDNQFREVIEMRIIDDSVAYINELPLEDYVKGLAEVSNSGHPEKLKTIAVLARTYARFYMDPDNRKFPGMPYDGNDDPAIFQRYLGYSVEIRSPNFVDAATQTRDQIVTYKGKLVKTPYFNQSDGRTRSAQEVWGWTTTPYLLSVSDPWSRGLSLNGHGVGLSGFGATKQAEEGKKFDEIIKYYYTGVAIEKMSF